MLFSERMVERGMTAFQLEYNNGVCRKHAKHWSKQMHTASVILLGESEVAFSIGMMKDLTA